MQYLYKICLVDKSKGMPSKTPTSLWRCTQTLALYYNMRSSVFESLQESTYFHINFYLQYYSLLSRWQRNILTFDLSYIRYYVWLPICIFPLSTTFLLSSRIWVYICFKAEPDVLEFARSLSLRRNDSNPTLGWMVRTCLRPILIQNFEYTIWYLLNAKLSQIKS